MSAFHVEYCNIATGYGREDEYQILLNVWEELSKKKMLLPSLGFVQATMMRSQENVRGALAIRASALCLTQFSAHITVPHTVHHGGEQLNSRV